MLKLLNTWWHIFNYFKESRCFGPFNHNHIGITANNRLAAVVQDSLFQFIAYFKASFIKVKDKTRKQSLCCKFMISLRKKVYSSYPWTGVFVRGIFLKEYCLCTTSMTNAVSLSEKYGQLYFCSIWWLQIIKISMQMTYIAYKKKKGEEELIIIIISYLLNFLTSPKTVYTLISLTHENIWNGEFSHLQKPKR